MIKGEVLLLLLENLDENESGLTKAVRNSSNQTKQFES